jgi:uncharacterized OB-fold protein
MISPPQVMAEFRPFFDATGRDHIAFPKCEECHRFHWYPLQRCPHCTSPRLTWTRVAKRATLYSWTMIHHAFTEVDAARVPYLVGLVDLIEAKGVRLVVAIDRQHLPQLAAGLAGGLAIEHRLGELDRVAFTPDGSG